METSDSPHRIGSTGGVPRQLCRLVSTGASSLADDEASVDAQEQVLRPGSKLAKLSPEVRNELKQALRDSSDWHPRLNEQVKKLTDIKNTRLVRSRIYVTSASTMHALFNVLRQFKCHDTEKMIKELGKVTDLNYLTHLVFRCYERNEQDDAADSTASSRLTVQPEEEGLPAETRNDALKNREKSRYRVEISMSPGVQVFKGGQKVQWPKGSELSAETSMVAPWQIVAHSVELTRFEGFLTQAIKEHGAGPHSTDEDDDKQSDAN